MFRIRDWKDELDKDAKMRNGGEEDEEDSKSKVKAAKRRAKRSKGVKIYAEPSRSDYMMREGSGSRYEEQDIIDWIGDELNEAEWIEAIDYDDTYPTARIDTIDGDRFEISVKKI